MNDAQRFILEHFDTIDDSPSNIYSHALPFSPPSSWLYKYYRAELSQGVRIVKGILPEWGICSRTVSFDEALCSLACWKDTIAVGLSSGDIAILDAITGSKVAVLSGHTQLVVSLTFSLDGTFFVSGSYDKNVKLWDVQTGGVVKTFHHASTVLSVSISPDCTTIASGSWGKTIHLWHTQAGDCVCVINGFNSWVSSVSFSPTDPQLLISASGDNSVQLWNTNGCQVGPTHKGNGVTFSSDGTYFVSWGGQVATVQNTSSGVVVAELQISSHIFRKCCFSPNGKLVVGSVYSDIYVWSVAGLDPHLITTLTGHSRWVTSLIFPASLISVCEDHTLKFWQIDALSTDPVAMDTICALPGPLSLIKSVSLQVKAGVAITSDSAGVVKTWDILTGHCRVSFQIPVKDSKQIDVQLIESRLIVVWLDYHRIYFWDGEREHTPIQLVDRYGGQQIRISGDGSKVFCLMGKSIQAWVIQTGEVVGIVELEDVSYLDPLCADGSKIWVCFKDSQTQGWDFGIPGSPPIPLSNTFPDRPHLNLIVGIWWEGGQIMIEDAATGKEVFQLVGRYAKPDQVGWDGQYLVASYESGEVLILDFNYALLQ